ncbi:hypothetical protein EDD21DRAFT_376048 [Dissophora ornata]|nr:hypothetical protein EDD21DRAFT_376048 [Dissophora ornata]
MAVGVLVLVLWMDRVLQILLSSCREHHGRVLGPGCVAMLSMMGCLQLLMGCPLLVMLLVLLWVRVAALGGVCAVFAVVSALGRRCDGALSKIVVRCSATFAVSHGFVSYGCRLCALCAYVLVCVFARRWK